MRGLIIYSEIQLVLLNDETNILKVVFKNGHIETFGYTESESARYHYELLLEGINTLGYPRASFYPVADPS